MLKLVYHTNKLLITCLMASTVVFVFPVPGGPKMIYGADPDVPLTMFSTAFLCSALDSNSLS